MYRWRTILQTLPLFLALTACSATDLVNALVSDTGYTITRGLRYGEAPRHRLDLYLPDAADDSLPVVIFFYGGNWQNGSKDDYLFVGEAFASRGYVTVIPDYRLYPDVRYPAFLEDAAAALDWLRNRSDIAAVRGKSTYLVGHSAGAYIAAMLALDRRWLADTGNTVCDAVAAMVGLAGPYDFLPLRNSTLKSIFGAEDKRPETQPINHVNGAGPPMLLISGRDDRTVFPRNSERLASRIRDAGGIAEALFYEDIGHVGLVASLAEPLRGLTSALDDTHRFLRRHPIARPCTQTSR